MYINVLDNYNNNLLYSLKLLKLSSNFVQKLVFVRHEISSNAVAKSARESQNLDC